MIGIETEENCKISNYYFFWIPVTFMKRTQSWFGVEEVTTNNLLNFRVLLPTGNTSVFAETSQISSQMDFVFLKKKGIMYDSHVIFKTSSNLTS